MRAVWQTCLDYCYRNGSVYCYQCDWEYDWLVTQCNLQYRMEYSYCQNVHATTVQGCQGQLDECQANCSYGFLAHPSQIFVAAAARAMPPLAAQSPPCATIGESRQRRGAAWHMAKARRK